MKPAVIKKRSHGNQTATLTVRAGKKGGGRLLGVVQIQTNHALSVEAGESYLKERAEKAGYEVVAVVSE